MLETVPVMEYVCERTNMAAVNEELLRGREWENGRHDRGESNAASGGPRTRRLRSRMADIVDRRRHAVS